MAVIRVRHSAVRAFGLAGKVVIIDEIHSYDTYTGTIIDELVALLRELNPIGNNVNQLAYQANARGAATQDEIREAARLVRQAVRLVRDTL